MGRYRTPEDPGLQSIETENTDIREENITEVKVQVIGGVEVRVIGEVAAVKVQKVIETKAQDTAGVNVQRVAHQEVKVREIGEGTGGEDSSKATEADRNINHLPTTS